MNKENMNKGNWIPLNTIGSPFITECAKICENEEMFQNFKRNGVFCGIIANDVRDKRTSDSLYNKLKDTELFKDIDKYKSNDLYGNPVLYEYPSIGSISPGTLYFMDILNDILDKFGDISNLNVIEIGSGYGGQAKVLLDYGVKSYTCVDVLEPLNLCKKYLGLFDYDNTSFITTNELEKLDSPSFKKYELVISNWCLSEFDEYGMSYYVDKIIKNVDKGYFLMNVWDKPRKDHIINIMKDFFPQVNVYAENIKSSWSNNFLLCVNK